MPVAEFERVLQEIAVGQAEGDQAIDLTREPDDGDQVGSVDDVLRRVGLERA